MNKIPDLQKALAQISANEKGWRKVLATAEGSYSRSFASEQLRRLEVRRSSLLGQRQHQSENDREGHGRIIATNFANFTNSISEY